MSGRSLFLLRQIIAARHRMMEQGKAPRLACWNEDGVRHRKLELEHFLNQGGVDICILIETFLNPGQAFRLANYVCHRTDKLTASGGTVILVRRGILHHSVPVTDLTYLEANAIQVIIISDNPCGIPFVFLTTDRGGPYRLFRRGVAGRDG